MLAKDKIKLSAFLAIVFCIIANISVPVFATELGTLSYWYSNDTIIGRWDPSLSAITVYKQKLNSNASFNFLDAISTACLNWDDVIGKQISSGQSSSFSSAPIRYFGGTLSEVNEMGILTVPSSYNGLTAVYAYDEGTWTYGGSTKTGKRVVQAIGAIIDWGHTANQYRNTCSHELGHALGWYGHSSSSYDVMYPNGTSITSLSNSDKNHLSQVY